MRKGLPNLLRDEGHERMQELERIAHHIDEHSLGRLRSFPALLQADFGKLDIPVAEHVPNEII